MSRATDLATVLDRELMPYRAAADELRRLDKVNAELLEALQECLKKGSKWHPCDPAVVAARAAISNATKEN